MIKYLPVIALFLVLMTGAFESHSQVYVGAGYAEAMLSKSGIDDVHGMAITIQKPYPFQNREKWSFDPSLKVCILNSRATQDFYPAMSTTLGFSPLFSYRLVGLSWLEISPFVGPYVVWLNWLKGDIDLPTRSTYANEMLYGIEAGLNIDFKINDKWQIRLTPFSHQWNQDYYRQGVISVAIAL
ncbi:porin family protein [Reichenbachiella ulvae]|uniref:Porin family protein n=1 Tax=Reichenbachiella ulvae TaxID=2980104 RepID=A0ABT3CQ94_9BACT|nr:porin family protein [Reichenbachiella ulvae]MCV9385644.1 porin family protein [Reichenbachiella ulvae]